MSVAITEQSFARESRADLLLLALTSLPAIEDAARIDGETAAMPIDKEALASIARVYVQPMTSIRGRRVVRLLAREFSRFDHVLAVVTEDGSAALLALSVDGRAAICCTDGRGASADIVEVCRLHEATVTTSYDLLKDSLPIVSWTLWHPGFARIAGPLTIAGADLSPLDRSHIADVMRWIGT
jgi:hypothetical protein